MLDRAFRAKRAKCVFLLSGELFIAARKTPGLHPPAPFAAHVPESLHFRLYAYMGARYCIVPECDTPKETSYNAKIEPCDLVSRIKY